MKTINCNKIVRIIKNRARLMKELNVHINNAGKLVTIDGTPEDEYMATQVIDALNFGFPYIEAISMKKEGRLLETVNIKEYTKKNDLERVRGRIIGKAGKGIRTIANLSDCAIEIQDNTVAIIGEAQNIQRASEAIVAVIKGAKHSGVYHTLEGNRPHPIHDLGLRDAPIVTMEDYEKNLDDDFDDEDKE